MSNDTIKQLKDPTTELPTGIATHVLQITIHSMMISSSNTTQKQIDDRETLLLNILPRGTEVVAVDSRDIVGLSLDFHFTLKHPFFQPGTKIELDFSRICWPTGDHVEQDSILTGIHYILPDGTEPLLRWT